MTRRKFIDLVGSSTLGFSMAANLRGSGAAATPLTLYIGTYTDGKSEGIYIYRMNPTTGELTEHGVAKGITNPSYLAIDRGGRHLYAVNEVNEFEGQPGGALTAFSIDRSTANLTRMNHQSSRGGSPCYVELHPAGGFAAVVNYHSGNFSILPINKDGSLRAATEVIQHTGSGGNAGHQAGPHAHCLRFNREGNKALAVDLGIDRVMIYLFDPEKGTFTSGAHPFYQTKSGAGPRHIDFHPSQKFVYLINELNSTMSALSYDEKSGELKELQTVSTLPEDFSGTNYPADIHVHPTGKFVYGTNRGHNSLVISSIDPRDGHLTLMGHVSTGGDAPRNFVIDPSGRFLLVANQKTDNVLVFRIDGKTGDLKPTGIGVNIPSPVCLKFLP